MIHVFFKRTHVPAVCFHPIWPVRGVREQVRVRELFVLFCGCVRVGCSRTRVFANCSFVFVRDLKSHEQPPLILSWLDGGGRNMHRADSAFDTTRYRIRYLQVFNCVVIREIAEAFVLIQERARVLRFLSGVGVVRDPSVVACPCPCLWL